MPKAKSFPSIGERVAAAVISYNLGHAGVDRALKQYSDIKVSDWWEEKGRQLQREAAEMLDAYVEASPDSDNVQ
jgi:hypothetical protein